MKFTFHYPEIPHGPDGLIVERLGNSEREKLEELAPAIVDLTRRAYRRQLELPSGPLTAGTIDSIYTQENKQKNVLWRIGHILGELGGYYIVRSPEDPNRLDGMLNVHEAYFMNYETGEEFEYEYITDIVTDPGGQGVGSALMHAAARKDGHASCTGTLDGYRGSSVNNWYESLGFENRGGMDQIKFGDHTIGTDRFVIPSLRDAIPVLEERHAGLRNLEVT